MTKKAAGSGAEEAPKEKAETVRTVAYVVNRPYSAGEAPEIVTARVKREHDNPDVLDLVLVEPTHGGEAEVKGVRKSDGQALGTWHEGVK
jgi:hypothetical protein